MNSTENPIHAHGHGNQEAPNQNDDFSSNDDSCDDSSDDDEYNDHDGEQSSPTSNDNASLGTTLLTVDNHQDHPANDKNKKKMMKQRKKKLIKDDKSQSQQPRWIKTWNHIYYRPLAVFFRAFVIAWIFVILPCDNYWIYYLIKNQYWCALTLTSYVELFSALLPDVPESIYIACYVFGFFVAPLTRILEYFYGMAEYNILNIITVLFSFVVIVILFGIDTLRYPYTKDQLRLREKMERKQSLTLPSGEPLPADYNFSGQGNNLYRSMFNAIGRKTDSSTTTTDEENDGGLVRAGLPVPASTISPSFIFAPSTPTPTEDPVKQVPVQGDYELHNQGNGSSEPNLSVDHFYERTSMNAAAKAAKKKRSEPTVFRTGHNNIKLVDPTLRYFCDAVVAVLDKLFVAKYFFFLPRFWNRRYWLRHSKLHPLLNRRWLIIRTAIFILIYSSDYVFLTYFTVYFREHANTNYKRVLLFLVYIGVNTTYRFIVKTLGMLLDKFKGKSVSMFFLGEVMGLFFYYCFYRVLFESIRSVPEFIGFQIMHLSSEWVLYVFRCTEWYYKISEKFVVNYSPTWLLNRTRMTHKNWQQFIALDFGIRCAVFITTGYGILLMLITIQYVSWVGNVSGLLEDDHNFTYTSLFIVSAILLELLNAWGMNRFFFHKQGLDVQSEVRHCFSLPHFALLALLVGCNLFTNPIFAFITVDYQK